MLQHQMMLSDVAPCRNIPEPAIVKNNIVLEMQPYMVLLKASSRTDDDMYENDMYKE